MKPYQSATTNSYDFVPVFDVFADSYLGEDGGPDRLNLNVGGLDQSLELVGL